MRVVVWETTSNLNEKHILSDFTWNNSKVSHKRKTGSYNQILMRCMEVVPETDQLLEETRTLMTTSFSCGHI